MALYIDPEDDTEAYDHVIFGKDIRTPGRCKVEGFSRDCEYDHKKGKGVKGSTSTLKGLPPAKGKITFWTWTAAQRRAWNPILDLLKFDPSKGGAGAGTAAAKPTDPTSQYTSKQGGAGSGSGSSSGTIPDPGSTGKKDETDTTKEDKADNTPIGKDSAIEVFYPTLADIGVHFFLPPEKLGIWEPDGDDFTYMKREIEFFEFVDQDANNIATTATGADANPNGSAKSAGGQGGTDPDGGAGTAGKEAQGAAGVP